MKEMITEAEIRSAADVFYRLMINDDDLLAQLPDAQKTELLDGLAVSITGEISSEKRMGLRALIAFIIHESKQEGK